MTHDAYYELAARVLPGAGLGGYSLPEDVRFVIRKGEGSRLEDIRGRSYIDYVGGAGVLILGHAHPAVIDAVQEAVPKGLHFFGTLNEYCIRLAEQLVDAIPCAEKIAYCTTGSEATFYAMRIARAFTGRNKILKCEGGYHGNHDYSNFSVVPRAVSNYPAGQPDTAGMPASLSESVLVGPYNDLEAVRRIVEENRDDLAAIIVEPVQRVIFPKEGYLQGLRALCDEHNILLIFDEVVTGFRLAYGGAQEFFGVRPDSASNRTLPAMARSWAVAVRSAVLPVPHRSWSSAIRSIAGSPITPISTVPCTEIRSVARQGWRRWLYYGKKISIAICITARRSSRKCVRTCWIGTGCRQR